MFVLTKRIARTMVEFTNYFKALLPKSRRRDVALVLGGGGARGYAHIGAVEVLLERGYNITSIAGTSMGALVGGLVAARKLQELKQIVLNISRRQILSLVNVSIGLDHVATADKLSNLLEEMTDGKDIEDLSIPFCCSASDLISGHEHVFRSGKLAQAIRASISIPGIFSPVRLNSEVLVDGSVHNTLPLNRVERHKGDLLIAVNASAPDSRPLSSAIGKESKEQKTRWEKIKGKLPFLNFQFSDNYIKMAMRVCQVTIQNNTQMALEMNKPYICVDVPMDAYGLLDFDRGAEIIEYGRKEMTKALDAIQ